MEWENFCYFRELFIVVYNIYIEHTTSLHTGDLRIVHLRLWNEPDGSFLAKIDNGQIPAIKYQKMENTH